jgi:hypothetical protein
LRIEIDHEHALPEHSECCTEIYGSRAFPDSAFLIDERDDPRD